MKKIYFLMITVVFIVAVACVHNTLDVKNNMKYRSLGNSNIKVSEIGIGCGPFEDMDTTQARIYMSVALDSSVNYIDIYDANPKVRANIGYALRGRRDKMIIQGHIGSYWNGTQYERTRDVDKCKKGFNDLLKLLETDYIEVGMMHIADNMEEWNAILGSPYLSYVQQLKQEGKIKHIGISSHSSEVALAAAKSGLVEVIMFSLNPAFDRVQAGANLWDTVTYQNMLPGIDPVRAELYDYCTQHNISIIAMKVYGGGGRLLDADKSPLHIALTPYQCLSYALAKPCVAVALSGTKNVEQLIEDLKYYVVSDEERDYSTPLSSLNVSKKESIKKVNNEGCTYCGHCSPCPAEIDIAKVNQLLDEAQKYDKVPAKVMEAYKALPHHAGECVSCGACESRCPFAVPIRNRMEQAQKIFGF